MNALSIFSILNQRSYFLNILNLRRSIIITKMLNNSRLAVNEEAPFDPLQAFMRFNHIALEGTQSGPLANYVFAVKDVFKILGSTYSNGHPKWLETHEPDDFTSSFIHKILNAGADLVGKTVCDELCYSISGENWHYGSPVNPHDSRRLTGGSSGGTGAAVAGGLVDFAFGSDCLGSVRVPASYNGLLGIRPTYNRIPNDGEAPYCESMDVLGYVAKEPEIFKEVTNVLMDTDHSAVSYSKLLLIENIFSEIDKQTKEHLQPALDFLENEIGTVKSIQLDQGTLEKWMRTFQVVQGYEVWESYGGWVNKYNPTLPPGQKQRLKAASKITLAEYYEALAEKESIEQFIEELVPPDTLLCLPTAATIAPLKSAGLESISLNRKRSSALLCISPLSGTPQVTLPLVNMESMPLGISLIGAKGTDQQLVEFSANCVEKFKKD